MAGISEKLIKELTQNVKSLGKKVRDIDLRTKTMDSTLDELNEKPPIDLDKLKKNILVGMEKAGMNTSDFPIEDLVEGIGKKFNETAKKSIDEIINNSSYNTRNNPEVIDVDKPDIIEKILEFAKSSINKSKAIEDSISPENRKEPTQEEPSLIEGEETRISKIEEPITELEETKAGFDEEDLSKITNSIIESVKNANSRRNEEILPITDSLGSISDNIKTSMDDITNEFVPLSRSMDSVVDIISDSQPHIIQETSIQELPEPSLDDKLQDNDSFNEFTNNIKTISEVFTNPTETLIKEVHVEKSIDESIEPSDSRENGRLVAENIISNSTEVINNINETLSDIKEEKDSELSDDDRFETIRDSINRETDPENIVIQSEPPSLVRDEGDKNSPELLESNKLIIDKLDALINIMSKPSVEKNGPVNQTKEKSKMPSNGTNNISKDKAIEGEFKNSFVESPETIRLLQEISRALNGPLKILDSRPIRPNSKFK